MTIRYAQPRRIRNAQGTVRTVGFELEFAGLDLARAAAAVANAVQGQVQKDTQAECKVLHPAFGDFNIELDWSFAKNMARKRLEEQGVSEDAVLSLMTEVARQIVPLELVCPPLPMDRLQELDPVVDSLRRLGALGTSDSLVYAFGVHINCEIPDFSAESVVAYLKAFCVAQGWLINVHDVDPVRRLTPYIDSYPKKYVQKVVGYSQGTTLQQVMDDYLAHNPTRNRGMDMLPLFKHMDPARVLATVKDERVKSRPTFHYRLPNCEIEKPGWSLAESWNVWCVLEYLVAHPLELQSMCRQWMDYHHHLINLKEEPWHEELASIHKNLLSA